MKVLAKWACLALVMGPAWASGQEFKKQAVKPEPAQAQGKVEPEAEKLLDESKAAMRKVRDASMEIDQTDQTGAKKGTVSLILEANAQSPFPVGAYRVAVLDAKGGKGKEWASDGKTLWLVDHAAKKVSALELMPGTMPPPEVISLMPIGFFLSEPFGAKVVSLVLKGDSEIGGVKCRVVEQTQEIALPGGDGPPGKVTLTFRRHVGPDLLVRKLDAKIKIQGPETKEETLVSEYRNLKTNAGLKPADMAVKAPEGYAQVKGSYDALGLRDPEERMPKLKAEVGKPALAFDLKTPAGKAVSLESLKGRVVLLDFWATWCGPCKMAMPGIQKLHEKYKDKPVTIIGVNCMEEDEKAALKYMEEKKFTYTLLLKGDDLVKGYGISGIPTLILIGKDGNILSSMVGFDPSLEESLSKAIDQGLAEGGK